VRTRTALALGLAAGLTLGVGLARGAQEPPHWSRIGYAEWQAYGAEARQAWVNGFLAGAAAGQSAESLYADSAALARWMTARPAGLRFPYGANIYQTRLQDWYFWENHRGYPVWQGMWGVNNDLVHPTR
jgi:hypothetical protein